MELLLTTHDTGYERPDGPTIAKVLASLDGGRNVLATLGTSDATYLQASGSVQTGFGLYLQEGSLDRRFRTRDRALPLPWVTEAFQRYAGRRSRLARCGRVGAGPHPGPARVLDDELARLHRAARRGRGARCGSSTPGEPGEPRALAGSAGARGAR